MHRKTTPNELFLKLNTPDIFGSPSFYVLDITSVSKGLAADLIEVLKKS
jgi:hypothetical protein